MLTIDHATVAASDLDALMAAFAGVGLAADYGGVHSNGVTHMAQLGFADGSYIELISTVPGRRHAPWWNEHIAQDGGACAWCVESPDIVARSEALRRRGVAVDGPHRYLRARPDGVEIEWRLSFVGAHGAGAVHPFLIQDTSARALRVQPSDSVAEGPLRGVSKVVLAVSDASAAAREMCRVYALERPRPCVFPGLAGDALDFAGQPFALLAPRRRADWLDRRLRRFGPSPCAILLGTPDLRAAAARHSLRRARGEGSATIGWFARAALHGVRLGVVEAELPGSPGRSP